MDYLYSLSVVLLRLSSMVDTNTVLTFSKASTYTISIEFFCQNPNSLPILDPHL